MKNPWHDLPAKAPYILPCDLEAVASHNQRVPPHYRFATDLLPEPYFGSPDAPVVVLMANPGVGANDEQIHRNPMFIVAARRSLIHNGIGGHFLHLRHDMKGFSTNYWHKKTRKLQEAARGLDPVAAGLLVLQLAPYHSTRFRPTPNGIPSQDYTIALLRRALERNALVAIMRRKREWMAMVPDIKSYEPKIFGVNPLNPCLSPGNLKEGWETLLEEIEAKTPPKIMAP